MKNLVQEWREKRLYEKFRQCSRFDDTLCRGVGGWDHVPLSQIDVMLSAAFLTQSGQDQDLTMHRHRVAPNDL